MSNYQSADQTDTRTLEEIRSEEVRLHQAVETASAAIRLTSEEMGLLRANLKHAQSLYEDMKRDRDKMREQRDTANKQIEVQKIDIATCVKLLEEGREIIIDNSKNIQRLTELVSGLESEADKARRVIAGNTDIENNGSLLDMLNALLAKQAEAVSNEPKIGVVKDLIAERDKYKQAASVLCGAHIGQPQDTCPVCERDTLRAGRLNDPLLAATVEPMRSAITGLVKIIDKAGLLNLSNGVELGQTSWYIKASEAMDFARTFLPKCTKCGEQSCFLEDGLCGNCTPF